MCIICECEKYGVTEQMLHEAHDFISVSEYMLYCIVAVNSIASMTAMGYFMRSLMLRKLAAEGDPSTERTFYEMGINVREYATEQVQTTQKEWIECLRELLTAYSKYYMMYSKYKTPVLAIEGVLEMAKKNLMGESVVHH